VIATLSEGRQLQAIGWRLLILVVGLSLAVGFCVLQVLRRQPMDFDRSTKLYRSAQFASWFCHWVVPAVWLYLAVGLMLYVLKVVWPQTGTGSLSVTFALTIGTALLFSYLPRRLLGITLPTIALIQFAIVFALGRTFIEPHPKPANDHFYYTLDENGNPVKVDGDLAPATQDSSYLMQSIVPPPPPTPPLSIRLELVGACLTIIALVLSELIAQTAPERTVPWPQVVLAASLLLAVLQSSELAYINHVVDQAGMSAFVDRNGPPPIGDLMQLVGSYLFGSAQAGVWFMLAEASILTLATIALLWNSLSRRDWLFQSHAESNSGWQRHGKILSRAGFAIAFAIAGTSIGNQATLTVNGAGVVSIPPISNLGRFPDSIFLAGAIASMCLCGAICLLTMRSGNYTHILSLRFLAIAGFWLSIVYLMMLFAPMAARPAEFLVEGLLAFAVFCASGLIKRLTTRRSRLIERRIASGQCLYCGYDLRETPDRCPECGTATSRVTATR